MAIDDNIKGKIEIVDTDSEFEFDNNNPVISVNNLQPGEWDKQLINDLFRDNSIFTSNSLYNPILL